MLIRLQPVDRDDPILVSLAAIVTVTPLSSYGGAEVWFNIEQSEGVVFRERIEEIRAML